MTLMDKLIESLDKREFIINGNIFRVFKAFDTVDHEISLTLIRVPGAFLARTRVFLFTWFERHIPLFQYLIYSSQIEVTLK